jgi:pimeloyl-ACP methyl ester carboxylesterase
MPVSSRQPAASSRPRIPIAGRLLPAAGCLLIMAGCCAVQVRKATVFVCLRDRTERLCDSHVVSDFTCEVLRRDGIAVHAAKHAPGVAVRELEALGDCDAARQLALAELCYRHARKLDTLWPTPSLTWYRDSACWASRAASSGDPNIICQASDIHNRAIERMVRLSQDIRCRGFRPWSTVFAEAGVQLAGVSPFLDPPQYENLTVARDIMARGMQDWYANDGYGVPLIAYRENDHDHPHDPQDCFFPSELRAGATAVMHPDGPNGPTLVFHDPFEEHTVTLGAVSCPPVIDRGLNGVRMATDRTAALASHVSWAYVRSLGKIGLRRSEAIGPDAGLRLFRPYQPGRIPVILIHGLRSTPAGAWVQTFNHLQNDPALAEHFQFWVYLYPTGAPLASNAARLRADLRAALATFDPGGNDPALRQMVLVGHSMGGLIAKMTAQDSGMAVWDSMFTVPPDELRVTETSRQELVEKLFFEREPMVSRLVFVATPHRGSEAADRPLGRLMESKIFRQDKFIGAVKDARKENGREALQPEVNVRRLDGIGGTRPGDPVLSATAELPISPAVPYHSIIPLVRGGNFPIQTDLVVKYRSSHIVGAESELIYPGIHTSTDSPRVACEIRRILLEHLAAQRIMPAPDRVAHDD